MEETDYKIVSDFDFHLGRAISSVGDVDGDGLDDILIGTYSSSFNGGNSGAAYVMLGSTLSSGTSSYNVWSDADYTMYGSQSDFFAFSVVLRVILMEMGWMTLLFFLDTPTMEDPIREQCICSPARPCRIWRWTLTSIPKRRTIV